MTEPTVTTAQTNPDAGAPPSAATPPTGAPAAPAAVTPPGGEPAAPAAAPPAGTTAVTGAAAPSTEPSTVTPPPAGETPVDYAALVDSLKVPDGMPESMAFAPEDKAVLKGIAEKAKLSPEQTKVVHDELMATRAADRAAQEAQGKAWADELKTDPDLAGEDGSKWATSKANAERGFTEFGTPELRQFLDVTQLGNNKMFVKLFAAIGERLAPDTTRGGGSNTPPASVDAKDVMYPDM